MFIWYDRVSKVNHICILTFKSLAQNHGMRQYFFYLIYYLCVNRVKEFDLNFLSCFCVDAWKAKALVSVLFKCVSKAGFWRRANLHPEDDLLRTCKWRNRQKALAKLWSSPKQPEFGGSIICNIVLIFTWEKLPHVSLIHGISNKFRSP